MAPFFDNNSDQKLLRNAQIFYHVTFPPDQFTLLFTKIRSTVLGILIEWIPWAIQWKFLLWQKDWELAFFTLLSLRHSQTHTITFSVTFWKPFSLAGFFGMITLAALCLILILELLDHFEDLDIDNIEDLELELELDIGDIEDLELDPELEGELFDNIQDILELLSCLEDLQL